jgi:hypothetical protein
MSEDDKTDLEILLEMMEDYEVKPEETLADFIEVLQEADEDAEAN